jgi:hypothetical protein
LFALLAAGENESNALLREINKQRQVRGCLHMWLLSWAASAISPYACSRLACYSSSWMHNTRPAAAVDQKCHCNFSNAARRLFLQAWKLASMRHLHALIAQLTP